MASAASSTRPPRVPRAFRVGSLGSGRRSPRRSRRASTPPVASAARGPHAVRVPLPASGPLAPPADVRAAVDRWPWRGGLEPCGDRPFAPIPPEAITGEIPSDLRGTLYRVGPGRCRVGATRYAHWFDGDGQIFAFAFGDDGRVSAGAKMVRTDRFVAQEGSGAPDRIAVRGAWTQASSPLQNLGRFPTNPGNTAPMAHAGKLFALCEGGGPIEIDRETLDTIGPHAFEGEKLPMGFSAHAKKDPRDGTLYTWGLAAPPAIGVVAAKIDARGTVLKTAPLPLPPFAFTLIHDCAMSENYLAFIVPPWTLEPGAGMVGALSGAASFGHAFEWRGDERGATLIVLRKSDLGVVVGPREIHAMSTYHFAGAHEDPSDPSDPSDAKKTLKIWVNELIGSRPNLEARFANMYDAEWAPDGYNLLAEYAVNLEDGTLESRDLLVPRASDADVDEAKKAEAATRAAPSSSSASTRFYSRWTQRLGRRPQSPPSSMAVARAATQTASRMQALVTMGRTNPLATRSIRARRQSSSRRSRSSRRPRMAICPRRRRTRRRRCSTLSCSRCSAPRSTRIISRSIGARRRTSRTSRRIRPLRRAHRR